MGAVVLRDGCPVGVHQMKPLPDPTFHEAVNELARLARWRQGEVLKQPRDAAWQAYAWIARCRAVVEAGDQ